MSDAKISHPVILVIGVSGSGKSTVSEQLAQHLSSDFLEGDSFHTPTQIDKMRRGIPLTDTDRWPWLDSIRNAIDKNLAKGRCVVVACSGLRKVYREHLIGGIPGAQLVFLKGDKEVIRARMKHRKNHFMPESLLDSQFETLEEPGPEENPLIVSIHPTVEETMADALGQLEEAT